MKFLKFLFILTLVYYVVWIVLSLKYSIVGISSEYIGIHIESLCNHEHIIYYGIKGFCAGLTNCFICTFFIYWFIPLYQIIYLIIVTINHFRKNKIKNN